MAKLIGGLLAILKTRQILERIGHDPLVANYVSFIGWDRIQALMFVTNSSIPPGAF
jgi:hypothetical protein